MSALLRPLRGLAITAVVIDTVLTRVNDAGFLPDGRVAQVLKVIAYVTACSGYPALLFAAGLAARAPNCAPRADWWRWLRSEWLLPLVLWTLIAAAAHDAYQWAIDAPSLPPVMSWLTNERPDALWLLYSVAICSVGARAFGAIVGGRRAALAHCVALVVWVLVSSCTTWGIVTRIGFAALFFHGGYLAASRCVPDLRVPPVLRRRWLAPAAVSLLLALAHVYRHIGIFPVTQSLPVCIAGVIAIVAVAARGQRRVAAWVGQRWKPLYLLHGYASAVAWTALLDTGIDDPVWQVAVALVAGFAVPLIVARLVWRTPLFRLLGFAGYAAPRPADASATSAAAGDWPDDGRTAKSLRATARNG